MSQLLFRFSLRLLVPTLALASLAALGDPLPPEAASLPGPEIVRIQIDAPERFRLALKDEAEALRLEAEAAKKAAAQTAAQMRWFLTLPAAGNSARRCTAPSCAS
jgi:hypothetical protein